MLSANVGQLLLAALLSTNAGSKCWQQMLANSETDQHVLTTFLRFGAFCILHSEMSTLEQLAAVAAACVIIGKKKRPKRYWVRPSLRARSVYSGSDLLSDLNQDDINPLSRELRCDGSVKNLLRMTSNDFENLLTAIGPKIARQDTNYRLAIPARERLAVT
ncbi:hypothetical protein J6590_054499 [Homalodisca vitripennis]|nr:hypothetical protein J6590_054499 [Homalodisca vitripennis]